MSLTKKLLTIACLGLFPLAPVAAQDISTSFNGFATGNFAPITIPSSTVLGFDATFSGGQQQQGIDGASYESGPAAYLFINGTFNGISGDGVSDDSGLIDFSGPGASQVTFFGANRGFGAGVGFEVFGLDDTTSLGNFPGAITQTTLNGSPIQTVLNSSTLGGPIGSIAFDLPGPASNPPYVLALDTFTATAAAAIPEPSSAAILLIGACAMAARRRRS